MTAENLRIGYIKITLKLIIKHIVFIQCLLSVYTETNILLIYVVFQNQLVTSTGQIYLNIGLIKTFI